MIWAILGDSTGIGFGVDSRQGYVERLRTQVEPRAPLRVLNLAQSGATSQRVLFDQVPRALRARPDIALVFVGGNDVWRGVTSTAYGRTMDLVAMRLATTGARVILVDLADLSRAPAAAVAHSLFGLDAETIAARIAAMNAELAAICLRQGHTLVTASATAILPDHFCADGFHPSAAGYGALADAIAPALWEAVRTFETAPA